MIRLNILFILAFIPFILNGQETTPTNLTNLSEYHDGNRILEKADDNFAINAAGIATKQSARLTINIQTGTSYTALVADRNGSIIYMNNGSANTVTLPTVATSGWVVGDNISVVMWGAGTTSIDPAVGVNINGTNTDVDITVQYGIVQFVMVTTNEWHIYGTK